jgi:hypothetical protein
MTTVMPTHGISDEDLGHQAAFVRALVVQRLEQIWATVAPHVNGQLAEEGLRPDPRFVEAGIRVLDRLSRIYRLEAPMQSSQDAGPVVDAAVLVSSQLRELEARVRDRG